MNAITQLLQSVGRGEEGALADLVAAVYIELHQMAARRIAREHSGAAALQTTELVNETWLRLFPSGATTWENRSHFFGAAAEAMRRVLVDTARHRGALRRGGDRKMCELDESHAIRAIDLDLVLDVDEALTELEQIDEQVAQVVKLRYFAGLTNREAAEVLHIGEATAQRNWAYARAWLFDRIVDNPID